MKEETPEKFLERMEKEFVPSMERKMNSIIASANLLKNAQGSNKRFADKNQTR